MGKRVELLLLIVLLVPGYRPLAKGPADKLTIAGPGLNGVVEVTDATLLDGMGLGVLEDFRSRVIPAPLVTEGYQIVLCCPKRSTALDSGM